MERELQIKGAGHLFLGSSGTSSDIIDPITVEHEEQNINLSDSSNVANADQNSQSILSTQGIYFKYILC